MAFQRQTRIAVMLALLAMSLFAESAGAVRPYTLRQITFKSQKNIFREDVLRKVIPLKEGKRFDPDSLRIGLERLRYLYAMYGYIRMEDREEMITDDAARKISVVIWIDEGRQFYIRSVTVLGSTRHKVDAELARLSLNRGRLYNSNLVKLFFLRNAPPSLAKVDPQSRVHLETDDAGTVAVTIDLRELTTRDSE